MTIVSNPLKLFSFAAGSVLLIAALALAHTVYTHATPRMHAAPAEVHGPVGKVTGKDAGHATDFQPHGIVVCGMATTAVDCEKIQTLLPM